MEKKFIVYAVVVALLLKAYVGSTVRPNKRWLKEHLPALRRNRHENKEFQQAFNEFGEDACYYVCIETVNNASLLPEREEFWIKELKKDGAAFNLKKSGTPGMRGKRLSAETRRRMSKAKAGAKHPDNRKNYAFVSPQGDVVTPHGLKDFCRANKLSISAMSRIGTGKQKAHRGWQKMPISS